MVKYYFCPVQLQLKENTQLHSWDVLMNPGKQIISKG